MNQINCTVCLYSDLCNMNNIAQVRSLVVQGFQCCEKYHALVAMVTADILL